MDDVLELIDDVRIVQRSLRNGIDPAAELDCATVLEELSADLVAEYPSVTVEATVPDSLCVRSDERLSVALDEALENAVIHNDNPAPTVDVSASADPEHGYAEITVADDGPGIPPSEKRTVMNPGENSPLEHGTGLGLWIAAMIVFTLDGDITIEDNDPEGSIVRFQVPLAKSER